MGRTHALSGAAVWMAAAPPLAEMIGQPLTGPDTLAGGLLCAGAALLPDLDTTTSAAARSMRPISWAAAKVIGAAAGGHRQATHSAAFVAAVFGLLTAAVASPAAPTVTAVLSGLCVGLALRSLGPARLRGGSLLDLGVLGVSTAVVALGWRAVDPRGWWPAAIAVGCAVHIAGDLLTSGGVRLLWPLPHRQALPIIGRTDGLLEHLTAAVLFVAVSWLGLAAMQ